MSDKMNTQTDSRIIDRKRGSNVLRETEINKATETIKPSKGSFSRRSFLGKSLAAGAVTMGAGLFANTLLAKEGNEKEKSHLKKGDAAILRFLAAAEIIEADLWQQYNELAGIQDSEVPGGTGSQRIPLPFKCWMRTWTSTSMTTLMTSSAISSSLTPFWFRNARNPSIWISFGLCRAVRRLAPSKSDGSPI